MSNQINEAKIRGVMERIWEGEEIGDIAETFSRAPYLQKKSEKQQQDITSREQFYIWLATPHFLRNPLKKKQLAKKLNVSTVSLDNWEKELDQYDSRLFFLANKVFIDRAILQKAKEGNYYHAKLAKELSGEYLIKQEITHKVLSADDIDRYNREARTELGTAVQGIREVSSEPNLLSQ